MTPTGDTKPKLLFYEPGASWYWVLTGPLAAVSVLLLEISSGAGVGLITPAIFLVMVSAFVALQVKAARIHTSVELSDCGGGEPAPVITGSSALACVLPSSTPHWSNESIPHTTPSVNT